MKCAALYARVSTNIQNTDNQLLALRDYVQRRGWVAIEYVDEGVSGIKNRRPRLDQLMREAKLRLFDVVIVARFDRFGRSLAHLVTALDEFQSLGIDFISVSESIDTTTPVGKMVFSVIGAIAEFERNLIRERIQAGLQRARAQGKELGRPKRIFDRYEMLELADQGISARKIAKKLKIADRTVRRILLETRGKIIMPSFAAPDADLKTLEVRKRRGKNK